MRSQVILILWTEIPHTDFKGLKGKPAIVIDSYIHAREPYSVLLCFKLASNIINLNFSDALNSFLS